MAADDEGEHKDLIELIRKRSSEQMDDATRAMYEKCLRVRAATDHTLRATKHLRKTTTALDGTEKPLKLRDYQVQMIKHLLLMTRFVVGDDCGLGKTLESIATLAYLIEGKPGLQVLVVTKKSPVLQWESEFHRFTEGIGVVAYRGTAGQRKAARERFEAMTGPKVLIAGYRTVVQDFTDYFQAKKWGVLILDEVTVVKTPKTGVAQVIKHISHVNSERVWGLTATLLKNTLMEGYGIFNVVYPPLFPMAETTFMKDYCIVQMKEIGRKRKVPTVVGYRPADIVRFRTKIEPFYLGRPKHEVADELPPLTIQVVKVGMSAAQHAKYRDALAGVLEVGGEEKQVTKLTAVTYCQEIANHPELIGAEGGSEKLDELLEMLTEGDLATEKVIVYTRFSKMVDIGMREMEKLKIPCARITGAENDLERKAAQDRCQDPKDPTRVIWITNAGNDAINLQAAKALVFYDTPFSAGAFLQTLGRMIRIGSIHDRVLAIHLVCRKTVDEKVVEIGDRKMYLIEAVLGKRLKGDTGDLLSGGTIDELFEALRRDALGVIGGS